MTNQGKPIGTTIVSIMMWFVLGLVSCGTIANKDTMSLNIISMAIIVVVPLGMAVFGTIAMWSPETLRNVSKSKSKQQTSTPVDELFHSEKDESK